MVTPQTPQWSESTMSGPDENARAVLWRLTGMATLVGDVFRLRPSRLSLSYSSN